MPKAKMHKLIYMDNNATTPLHPQVKKVMAQAMAVFGNPSSLHSFGREAKGLVEEAREKVARFINAEAQEIIFTGSGSEANNTVLNTLICASKTCPAHLASQKEIITTSIEHPCILKRPNAWKDGA